MQMENIASYPFMQKCIQAKQTQIHAMWYDIHSGEVYLFSKSQKVSSVALCSKNFLNVKLRLDFEIWSFYRNSDFAWNHILANSNGPKM